MALYYFIFNRTLTLTNIKPLWLKNHQRMLSERQMGILHPPKVQGPEFPRELPGKSAAKKGLFNLEPGLGTTKPKINH